MYRPIILPTLALCLFAAPLRAQPGTATSAAGGERTPAASRARVERVDIRFSPTSYDALEQIRNYRTVMNFGKYGILTGPFLELFTESGAKRLNAVVSVATADWESLAREAARLSDKEAETIALIAENTQRSLRNQGWSGMVSREEIEFWARMVETYRGN